MTEPLKRTDYLSDAEPRWCTGCGDYSILKSVTQVFADLQLPREDTVVVSGIGCSSRFPYYVNTFGFHTIHGRAPTVATGIKLANPKLSVWLITGDGDGLSIGGNHFIHLMRRNIDINVILFNNEIYGLTKGQYSPTSPKGQVSKSTPYGSVDRPIQPMSMAIAAGATFAARVSDVDPKGMTEVMKQAEAHRGVSFIEVLQNCPIFNDGVWTPITKKSNRPEATVTLEHGKPLVFGKDQNKGIRQEGTEWKVADLVDGKTDGLVVHDAESHDPSYSFKLSSLKHPEYPYPLGIFRKVALPTYDKGVQEQMDDVALKKGKGKLEKLLHMGETWQVTH